MSVLLFSYKMQENFNMKQNSKFKIAQNVEKLRKKNKITKEKLSLLLGFDNSYISKLEKEKINITIDKIDKIADFFEVESYQLLK